jgi:hypothetical protein
VKRRPADYLVFLDLGTFSRNAIWRMKKGVDPFAALAEIRKMRVTGSVFLPNTSDKLSAKLDFAKAAATVPPFAGISGRDG